MPEYLASCSVFPLLRHLLFSQGCICLVRCREEIYILAVLHPKEFAEPHKPSQYRISMGKTYGPCCLSLSFPPDPCNGIHAGSMGESKRNESALISACRVLPPVTMSSAAIPIHGHKTALSFSFSRSRSWQSQDTKVAVFLSCQLISFRE